MPHTSSLPLVSPSPALASGPTTVDIGSASFGGRGITVIAGPCSVEGREMLLETAHAVRDAGAMMLRGGAFKPRTSPYAFRGMGELGLELLAEARALTGLPVVTEVVDARQIDLVAGHVDMLQIGARNMHNFALLSEVGRSGVPVLLKRGFAATVSELLHAAEYILVEGNASVVLCERGIRTFETATRNTLDVAAIPVLKAETHLPVIVDPSHAAGRARLVPSLAAAAIAAGADGLIVEVHPAPDRALSDGEQSLTGEQFASMMRSVAAIAAACGRSVGASVRAASCA
jgi:3-deoxy-7-phosphoheptulonate synthase